jgi:hypothetical protein
MMQAKPAQAIFPRSAGVALCAAAISLAMVSRVLAAETDAQASRIKIEYFDPANPALRSVYELVKQRRTLERIQETFGAFRLPTELTIRTGSCEGVANAWYDRPAISVCYEYLDQIYQSLPKRTTADGVTAEDAVIGETFYVFGHEMGHAIFDLFHVPMLGDAENAADHFAGYMMLQFGRDQARALITGAAYTYNGYMQNPQVMAPLKAFSDIHGAPEQRYYNLLCLAYGAEPTLFADLVSKGYLPNNRAINCKREYDQVAYGFREFVAPHLEHQLEQQALDKTWLPEVKAPDLSQDHP